MFVPHYFLSKLNRLLEPIIILLPFLLPFTAFSPRNFNSVALLCDSILKISENFFKIICFSTRAAVASFQNRTRLLKEPPCSLALNRSDKLTGGYDDMKLRGSLGGL